MAAVVPLSTEVQEVAAKVAVTLEPDGSGLGDTMVLDGALSTELPPTEPASVPRRVRSEILGCPLDHVDLQDAVAYCEEVIATGGFAQHMAVNAAKLVAMRHDPQLHESVTQCELITADGQSIVWASQLLGDPLPCRVAGIDLMQALLECSAQRGYRVYVLGATPAVLERAIERMRAHHPELVIAGARNGYYADSEEAEVAAEIAAARPDILFVAMSSPRKEYFLARYGRAIDVPFVMGVGGSIDVYAGLVQRAPVLMQRAGLEWLFRLAQEPRRLAKRYVTTNAEFLLVLGRALLRRRVHRQNVPV
jgi:N-acetylglucosaminyldiphosphoundecaprenol N-acetyl-beta-D-mannosaminyltransferase